MSSTPAAGPSSSRSSPVELSGPELSRFIWETKYRTEGEEGVADSWRRIARAAASVETDPAGWGRRFFSVLKDFAFLPGGRVQAGAGRPGAVLFNCFVLPGPGVSAAATMRALDAAVATLRAGGGVGCDFSGAAPKGWPQADGPPAPGPVAFLHLWDEACRTFLAGAARQGAMMGVLRCDHPDLEAFVAAKREAGVLPRFNLSVAVTDAFMSAVRNDQAWGFRYPAEAAPVRTVSARSLWSQILRNAYDRGEPGVLFIDRIDASNNLAWRERIAATNPCGEVPLPEFGACDLGSLNLTRFVRAPFTPDASLDLPALGRAAAVAVRLLDNVIEISAYPLPEQEAQARLSRRIGLGITGLADALVMLGETYGEAPSLATARRLMRAVRDAAYRASARLAMQKGPFPAFDRERFLESEFVRRLPADIRERIAEHGLRNSHLIAIAPTGSISLLAGGLSTGLEPIFAGVQERTTRGAVGEPRRVRTVDPALAVWRALKGEAVSDPPGFVTARELPIAAHLEMQAALQPFVDNSIAKTVNVSLVLPFDAFRTLFERAYALGLKGCTAFRPTHEAVLNEGVESCAA
jgi:ribonucleoside-diphosphate reductase alpha chain